MKGVPTNTELEEEEERAEREERGVDKGRGYYWDRDYEGYRDGGVGGAGPFAGGWR